MSTTATKTSGGIRGWFNRRFGTRHRPHFGFYSGRKKEEAKQVRREYPDGGTIWGSFKSTMKYSMKKHGIFGPITGLASFFVINPIFNMQYKFRKNALDYSKKKEKITEEQYNLRMIRLEESNAAQMYRNGYINQEDYDKMMDDFEERYSVQPVKSK